MGVQFSQLITDFGHTPNLVASAKLEGKARQADAEASREDIVLETDRVFFSALEAQATLKVADETPFRNVVTSASVLLNSIHCLVHGGF